MSTDEPERPLLRVVRGDPTAEELAGLVAVLAARAAVAAGAGGAAAPRRTAWNDPARLVREPVRARPGGWHASALPR